jgi:uncharacterized protein
LKFRIEDIPPEGRQEQYTWEEKELADRLAVEKTRSFRFLSPITIDLHLSCGGSAIVMKSRISAKAEWLCARCLDPFVSNLSSEFTTTLKPKPSNFEMPEEVELRREDLETEFYDGEEVEVTHLVQDQILLTLPQKAVCREECRGLCPRCGKNLNREVCHCKEEAVDPRLAPLKSFRVH